MRAGDFEKEGIPGMGLPGFGSDCVQKVVARKNSVATLAGGSWEHLCAHLRPIAKGEPLLRWGFQELGEDSWACCNVKLGESIL